MPKPIRIAIDGPAASGKSTSARLLAKKLGYLHIDTGSMYRAATLAVIKNNLKPTDEANILPLLSSTTIELKTENGNLRVFLDAKDVSDSLRTPEIDHNISQFSALQGVRQLMVDKQRELARNGGIVMDGRDIGTVVLPGAELKVFLIASLEERAARRLKELSQKGIEADFEIVKQEIARRDHIDSARTSGPLKKAKDARELDTSRLSIEEQVEHLFQWAMEIIDSKNQDCK
ncbi:MAG: (d)CMP kinase [Caldithrix sp.]|nr:(d)CMP kinase [Caldithrix sp.]